MHDYTTIMIARKEYEQRVESLAPVQDFDASWHHDRPRLAKQLGQVLCRLGHGLASIGERMSREHGIVENAALPVQEATEA